MSARRAEWAGVVSLSLGVFAIVMSEFLPASLLPRIADDLDVSDGVAGQSVTMTAVAAALSALLISVVLPHADRRRVMTGLTLLAVVSDLVVALAPNLVVLLSARVLLGGLARRVLGHGHRDGRAPGAVRPPRARPDRHQHRRLGGDGGRRAARIVAR